MIEGLGARIRSYTERARGERGDVAMGCVRLTMQPRFIGIVFEKPGGSSAQFEASYDPEQGFTMLGPDGNLVVERDPDRVYESFVRVIDAIPAERLRAIRERIAQWRAQGYEGARLRAMVMTFNMRNDGTRGGELAPEELRFAAQLVASPSGAQPAPHAVAAEAATGSTNGKRAG